MAGENQSLLEEGGGAKKSHNQHFGEDKNWQTQIVAEICGPCSILCFQSVHHVGVG